MGSGIAQVAAMHGFKTIQFDVNPDMLSKSRNSIESQLQKLVSKSIIQEVDKENALSRLHFTSVMSECVADLVIQAPTTHPIVVEGLLSFVKLIGKTPVLCKDSPGFIVNRVARPYYLEALHLLAEGNVSVETIDALMESAGFKMGPFKLMDLIGLDINFSVSNIVWTDLNKPLRLKPSSIQQEKISLGALGKKTAKGFYDYTKIGQ